MTRIRSAAIAASLVLPATLFAAAPPAFAAAPAGTKPASEAPAFTFTGRYANGGAEVSAVLGSRLYVIGDAATLDIVSIANPAAPKRTTTIDLTRFGAAITSVAARDGYVAVALPAADKTDPGTVVILDAGGAVLTSLTVGANPDMLTFDKNAKRLVVANEGEPNSYAPQDDPEGSVSVIDVKRAVSGKKDAVTAVTFTDFNRGAAGSAELPADVRIFGPGATVAQDLEPEYVTIDGDRAFVTLQENNAIAEIDLKKGRVVAIRALALKDHSAAGNGLDASDRDGRVNIASWPVFGAPLPDAVASFTVKGSTYLITANEGDARDWPGYAEEARIGSGAYVLDPTAFPNAEALRAPAALGRLNASRASGDTDGDGDYDRIVTSGTRSATIWSADSTRIWDSGDILERATAAAYPANFNASNENNILDDRSDNKGPEPEGVAVGEIGKRTYAFVGLERIGGFAVFDVTDPAKASFVQYVNSRDFAADPSSPATDSGPEVLSFVSAKDSPSGRPLVVVSNEVSHTVSIWTA
ncbi:MAG TPA: choice-of-anchor I family protein [Naasia sp.]|jgi:hypothetical protein